MKKKRIQKKTKSRHIIAIIVSGLTLALLLLSVLFGLSYWDYKNYSITKENNAFDRIAPSNCKNKQEQDVHIVYITDTNYIYPTQVSAYSAIKNKCPQSTYYFHIMTDNVPQEEAEQAFKPLAREDVHFDFIPQQKVLDVDFSEYLEHISAAALLKFMIPVALPNVDRAIFFDSDTIITKDLQDLYNVDLGINLAAGVPDIGAMAQPNYLKLMGYKEKYYFNAGMFVLDLKQMRAKDIPNRLNDYVRGNPHLVYIDQDAYNVVLRKRIMPVHYKYNCMAGLHLDSRQKVSFKNYLMHRWFGKGSIASSFILLNKEQLPFFYRNLFDDVVMFHYFGFAKPWKGPVKNKQMQLFFNLWQHYADGLQKEHGLSKREIIFYLPRKKDKKNH